MANVQRSNQSKNSVRMMAKRLRNQHPAKDLASDRILGRVASMESYQRSRCTLWYVDAKDEVRTRRALETALIDSSRIAIPYCVDQHLALFALRSMDELTPGKFGILEPDPDLVDDEHRRVHPSEVDFAIIPGLAFDRSGGRMGYGMGYFDRCLAAMKTRAVLVGLAYHCQVLPQIPQQKHDIPMDWVATELELIDCRKAPPLHDSVSGC